MPQYRRYRQRPLWRTAIDAGTFICILIITVASLQRLGIVENLYGRYRISDGDSLQYKGDRIRLLGIDAPELQQTCSDNNGIDYDCGREAKRALQRIIGNSEIKCSSVSRDRYDRKLATCKKGSLDINAEMVRQGWAISSTDFGSNYMASEREAREAHRGIWYGTFEKPQDFRRRNRRINGNIGSDDEDD